jgi:hypothetical protein
MRPRRRVQSLARAELRALLKGWRLVRLPRQAGQIPAKLSQPSMQEEQLGSRPGFMPGRSAPKQVFKTRPWVGSASARIWAEAGFMPSSWLGPPMRPRRWAAT